MVRKILAMTVFSVLCVAFFEYSYALRPAMSLSCLVGQANLIIFAKVETISKKPILEDEFGPIHAVEIVIKKAIKGEPELRGQPTNKLSFTLRLELTEQASLEIGHEYVLFLKSSEAGPYILNGGQGAVEVIDGKVQGSEQTQNKRLDLFIDEIERARKQACTTDFAM